MTYLDISTNIYSYNYVKKSFRVLNNEVIKTKIIKLGRVFNIIFRDINIR